MTAGLLPFTYCFAAVGIVAKTRTKILLLTRPKSQPLWKNPGKVKPKKIDLGNSAPFLPVFPTLTKKGKSFNSAGLFNGPF
jgi:hypothetical protein